MDIENPEKSQVRGEFGTTAEREAPLMVLDDKIS